MCNRECKDSTCPFAFTYESEEIQNYGCLPTPFEITAMRIKHNKTWACHSDYSIPCKGALEYLRQRRLPYKVVDKELVKETDDWAIYCK